MTTEEMKDFTLGGVLTSRVAVDPYTVVTAEEATVDAEAFAWNSLYDVEYSWWTCKVTFTGDGPAAAS